MFGRRFVSVQGAGQEVGAMARSLGAVVENNQEQFQRIVMKAERSMDRFESAVVSIDQFITDNDITVLLEQSLQQFPELLTDAREIMSSLQGVLARADQNLQNLEQLTEPLGEVGPKVAKQIEQNLDRFDELSVQLIQFSRALNESDGTLAQLINNRELYDRLNHSLANIETLSRRLRPVVDDARVFTDKIAGIPVNWVSRASWTDVRPAPSACEPVICGELGPIDARVGGAITTELPMGNGPAVSGRPRTLQTRDNNVEILVALSAGRCAIGPPGTWHHVVLSRRGPVMLYK